MKLGEEGFPREIIVVGAQIKGLDRIHRQVILLIHERGKQAGRVQPKQLHFAQKLRLEPHEQAL